jgi:hypothetical protein
MVVSQVLDSVVDKVVEYCSRDDTRSRLEAKVLAPAVRYVADKFAWGVRVFQVVAVLVLIQTLVLLWLLVRDMRRPVALPAW